MHYEIMGRPESPHVDCIQFHVSSTRSKAETYVRAVSVASYSWWQVHPQSVDSDLEDDEGNEVYFYGHRGARLKSAPLKKAIASFHRHAARYPELFRRPPSEGN